MLIDLQAHLAARPPLVNVACLLLGVAPFCDSIDVLLRIAFQRPNFSQLPEYYLSSIFTIIVAWLLLYFVFRGKNWARWLELCLTVLVIVFAFALNEMNAELDINLLIDIVAIFLLFRRSSTEWFTKSKYADENSEPSL
ncbi:MAG TPA: hypothetical protein VG938_13040 [Verrucomicrobiae bacterium]|nr:hypothetical protein [Verrucomicrobiae bacterium]